MQINDGYQIHIPFFEGDIGDVRSPDLVGSINSQIPQQIGIGLMLLTSSRGVFARKNGSKAHNVVVGPINTVFTHLVAFVLV